MQHEKIVYAFKSEDEKKHWTSSILHTLTALVNSIKLHYSSNRQQLSSSQCFRRVERFIFRWISSCVRAWISKLISRLKCAKHWNFPCTRYIGQYAPRKPHLIWTKEDQNSSSKKRDGIGSYLRQKDRKGTKHKTTKRFVISHIQGQKLWRHRIARLCKSIACKDTWNS